MKQWIAVAAMAVGAAAYAQGADAGTHGAMMSGKASAHGKAGSAESAMGGWTPSKVTHEDTKGVDALWKSFGEAFMKKDVNAAAALVDFPVLMVTDDGKGNVSTASWDHDTWVNNMQKTMQAMPEPKKGKMPPMPRPHTDFLTNDIAVTVTTEKVPMGKTTVTSKSSSLLIHKDGKWLIKSMAEGGWGNMMGGSESK